VNRGSLFIRGANMINLFHQLWGALFYLLNKIFFSMAERASNTQDKRKWFILGNVSCAMLMGLEGYNLLMIQQLISLIFVVDAYLANKRLLTM